MLTKKIKNAAKNLLIFDRTLWVEYLFNEIKSLSLAFVMLVLSLVQTTDFSWAKFGCVEKGERAGESEGENHGNDEPSPLH